MNEIENTPLQALLDLKRSINLELKRRKEKNNTHKNKKMEAMQKTIYGIDTNIHVLQPGILRLPQELMHTDHTQRLRYLPTLLGQDWSSLFDSESPHGDFYVYAHIDPNNKKTAMINDLGGIINGVPFYIGKGRLNRAYDFKRNQGHGLKLKTMANISPEKIVHFFSKGMTEDTAFELESKLIYFYGTIYDKNCKGILLNLDIGTRPKFAGTMLTIPSNKYLKKNRGL